MPWSTDSWRRLGVEIHECSLVSVALDVSGADAYELVVAVRDLEARLRAMTFVDAHEIVFNGAADLAEDRPLDAAGDIDNGLATYHGYYFLDSIDGRLRCRAAGVVVTRLGDATAAGEHLDRAGVRM